MRPPLPPLPLPASTTTDAAKLQRRHLLQRGTLVLLLGAQELAHGALAQILAVRVWPAPEYSRITLESNKLLQAKQFFVADPPRLAVDIQGLNLNRPLRELVAQVRPEDPNIARIRVAQNTPNVVRLVVDLKQDIQPEVFNLPPIAPYAHRLVFDLYPTKAHDPLEALISERFQQSITAMSTPGASPETSLPPGSTQASTDVPKEDLLDALIAQHHTPPAPAPTPQAAPPVAAKAPAAPAPSAQPSPKATARSTDRIIIIALDPGHGGEDPGAIGPNGTKEKDVVLQIARLLRDRINATSVGGNPMRAFMTRDADFFVPLASRVEKAQRVQADLFISIHADAFTTPSASGASVFALSSSGASSSAARWLANKENNADMVGGLSVRNQDRQVQTAMLDMSTTAQIKDSLQLGSKLLTQIGGMAKLHKPRVEQAGFAVLKAPDIPSVLVETAFISNPGEEAKLRSPAYQRQLADALMRGITGYFASNPPLARSRSV